MKRTGMRRSTKDFSDLFESYCLIAAKKIQILNNAFFFSSKVLTFWNVHRVQGRSKQRAENLKRAKYEKAYFARTRNFFRRKRKVTVKTVG